MLRAGKEQMRPQRGRIYFIAFGSSFAEPSDSKRQFRNHDPLDSSLERGSLRLQRSRRRPTLRQQERWASR